MKNASIFKTKFLSNYWKYLLVSLLVGTLLFIMDEGGKALNTMPEWGDILNIAVFIILISILITAIQALVFSIWKNSLLSVYTALCGGIPIGLFIYFFLMTFLTKL